MVSDILDINEVEGVGPAPRRNPSQFHWMHLIIRNTKNIYIVKGW